MLTVNEGPCEGADRLEEQLRSLQEEETLLLQSWGLTRRAQEPPLPRTTKGMPQLKKEPSEEGGDPVWLSNLRTRSCNRLGLRVRVLSNSSGMPLKEYSSDIPKCTAAAVAAPAAAAAATAATASISGGITGAGSNVQQRCAIQQETNRLTAMQRQQLQLLQLRQEQQQLRQLKQQQQQQWRLLQQQQQQQPLQQQQPHQHQQPQMQRIQQQRQQEQQKLLQLMQQQQHQVFQLREAEAHRRYLATPQQQQQQQRRSTPSANKLRQRQQHQTALKETGSRTDTHTEQIEVPKGGLSLQAQLVEAQRRVEMLQTLLQQQQRQQQPHLRPTQKDRRSLSQSHGQLQRHQQHQNQQEQQQEQQQRSEQVARECSVARLRPLQRHEETAPRESLPKPTDGLECMRSSAGDTAACHGDSAASKWGSIGDWSEKANVSKRVVLKGDSEKQDLEQTAAHGLVSSDALSETVQQSHQELLSSLKQASPESPLHGCRHSNCPSGGDTCGEAPAHMGAPRGPHVLSRSLDVRRLVDIGHTYSLLKADLQRIRQKAAELRAQTADIALPSASPCCEQKQEQQQQPAAACRLPAGPGIASCSSSSSTSLN
ncbi:hypothetical protein, conserved [Eimeria acervulina]|uniref:Uncharacterized protein n=1 Tax=Eimeria acervulina TaxID=5801 RepID=U6GWI3_EIMAC|nr:hypothetical protein, conserved [Eimeria acervulina]CDI84520.1 hypothetical protein, conserved [Eimeria acervulina]